MVRVLIYHGGSPEFLRMCYVGGQIFDQGDIDVDLLSITDWAKKLQELGYMNYTGYWYKLDDEVSYNGLAYIRNDNDIVNLIGRILTENRRVLHLYVEHETDQPDLIEPTEQPVEASELCLVVGEDSSDDADYEPSSKESDDASKLSDYETTDAEDEDLYTTVMRGKTKMMYMENLIGLGLVYPLI
jgi:hypothetical protein